MAQVKLTNIKTGWTGVVTHDEWEQMKKTDYAKQFRVEITLPPPTVKTFSPNPIKTSSGNKTEVKH